MPSIFGIMEQDQIGLELARAPERIITVDRDDHLVSLRAQSNPQHFQIRGIVIDHQYPRWSSQATALANMLARSATDLGG
jgi:hypothetical protein